jgi:protein-S-isoprenylcysteine O-methyltransferase Ste14
MQALMIVVAASVMSPPTLMPSAMIPASLPSLRASVAQMPTTMMTQDDFKLDLSSRVRSMKENILYDGEPGKRGEEWFIGQMALIFGVLSAPGLPLPLKACTQALGLACMCAGGSALVVGALSLGDSLTPWPKPTEGNALVTEGAFGLCRHPIYSGLLLASVGFAFVTQSFERLLVSGALLWLLNKKAAKVEGMLRERHGKAFDAWAKRVPRFIPRLDELIDAFLAARGKSS